MDGYSVDPHLLNPESYVYIGGLAGLGGYVVGDFSATTTNQGPEAAQGSDGSSAGGTGALGHWGADTRGRG